VLAITPSVKRLSNYSISKNWKSLVVNNIHEALLSSLLCRCSNIKVTVSGFDAKQVQIINEFPALFNIRAQIRCRG
jgi:hypothetical protein